jgi:hypothetical protein
LTEDGLEVKFGQRCNGSKPTVSIGQEPELHITDFSKHLFPLIDQAQINYGVKSKIWNILKEEIRRNVRVGQLMALKLDAKLINAIPEYVLADDRS